VTSAYDRQLEINRLNQELICLEPEFIKIRDRRRELITQIKGLSDDLMASLGKDESGEDIPDEQVKATEKTQKTASRPGRRRGGTVLFPVLKRIQATPNGIKSRLIQDEFDVWPSYLTGVVKEGYVMWDGAYLRITEKGEAYIQAYVPPLDLGP
jgi:hypothetical protein